MNIQAHVIISGDVTGVGYRSWVVRNARELGLTGWVRNITEKVVYPERSRRVEAIFEGSKEKVEEMVKGCRKGPEVARVEKVDVNYQKPTDEFLGFEIRY